MKKCNNCGSTNVKQNGWCRDCGLPVQHLTQAMVRSELKLIGMTLRKHDGDFSVGFAGAPEEQRSFTTSTTQDDLRDALNTALAMARSARPTEA